jgi:hypothetical protein
MRGYKLALRVGWGVRSIHKQLQCVVKICAAHLN